MTPLFIDLYGMKPGRWFLHLYALGDIHYGCVSFDQGKLLRDIAMIRNDPLARVVLMGDLCEYINYTDARFDPAGVDLELLSRLDDLPHVQARQMVRWIEPIKDKILFALEGNHEDKIRRRYHNDIHAWFCMELGIPQAGYSVVAEIRCYEGTEGARRRSSAGMRSVALKVLAHHGWGGGRLKGGKVNKVDQIAAWFDYDVCFFGYVHEKMKFPSIKLMLKRKGRRPHIVHQERRNVLTGTYTRTYTEGYSGYAEKAGYPPTPLGCVMVAVRWVWQGKTLRVLEMD